jgi:hypothetical protein
MGKKLFFAVLSGLLFLPVGGFSKELLFQIVQYDKAASVVSETALVFEDEMLDYFFNAGFVVTNIPAVRAESAEDDTDGSKKLFEEAASDGSYAAVQIKVYLNSTDSTNPGSVKTADIVRAEWVVTNVMSGKSETGTVGRPVQPGDNKSDEDSVRKYAVSVADQIRKVLEMKA